MSPEIYYEETLLSCLFLCELVPSRLLCLHHTEKVNVFMQRLKKIYLMLFIQNDIEHEKKQTKQREAGAIRLHVEIRHRLGLQSGRLRDGQLPLQGQRHEA